jgi:beta-galactosidase
MTRCIAVSVIAVLSPLAARAAKPDLNLARTARVSASQAVEGNVAQNAVDGLTDTIWWEGKQPAQNAWFELDWDAPMTVREIVVRQEASSRRIGISAFQVEVWAGGNWRPVANRGDSSPIPAYVLVVVAPVMTNRLRLSGIHGNTVIREIEVYEGPNAPVIDVRGDARGSLIGILSDAWGAGGIGNTKIDINGSVRGRPWTVEAETSAKGEFEVPLPPGLSGPLKIAARGAEPTAQVTLDARDIHQGFVPAPAQGGTVALTGKWRFRLDPPQGFEQEAFDDRAWDEIEVPSHWIMKGFRGESGIGGYRRQVQVPAQWNGQRVRIALDGVYSGTELWVNGKRAGSHLGPNSFQIDITDFVRPGGMNIIAARVTERTPASEFLDHMSAYADFPLAGIYRKAYLFSAPSFHVARFHAATKFDADYRDAVLAADVTLVNEADAGIRGARVRVALMDGASVVGEKLLDEVNVGPWEKVQRTIDVGIKAPRHWEAEHPNLYTLRVALTGPAGPIEEIERKVGFRDVRVVGTEFQVNAVPVKLKGACHHDSHPVMGRAVTPELERRDLELMKEANLQSLRTSHYPPLPELLDIADELGVYVEAEASFCWADDSYDVRHTALAKQFTSELVERDRSHPSIVLWSAGNESLWGPILLAGEAGIRSSDKTRPVVGSWLRNHFDLEVLHNPMDLEAMRAFANATRPINWDESLGIFQGIWGDGKEIWRDPGFRDYYVAPLREIMDEFWKSKVISGSFIWAWSDDIFAVPGRSSEYGRDWTPWHAMNSTYGLEGRGITGDAPWGVIDGWRRKKPEFYHIQKLHSPIVVRTSQVPALGPDRKIVLHVENRYDFTPLSELDIGWELDGKTGTIRSDLKPKSKGQLEIVLPEAAKDGAELVVRFQDRAGRSVETSAVRIGTVPAETISRPTAHLKLAESQTLGGRLVRIIGDGFEVGIDRTTGMMRRVTADGRAVLYQGPLLSIMPSDPARAELPSIESWKPAAPVEVRSEGDRMLATAKGTYPQFHGTYETAIEPSGDISVTYDFIYEGEPLSAREVGMVFGLPRYQDTLSWERQGEWTWYPADHIGRTRGTASARAQHASSVPPDWPFAQDDSEMGTNDFRSTKRNFTSASLTGKEGFGVRFRSDGSQHIRSMVDSDRIAVHVNDWFGGSYSREEWRHFGSGKTIQTGERLRGAVRFRLIAGKAPKLQAAN